MRTEAKPALNKKNESKRAKGTVRKAFYYKGKLLKIGDVVEGYRHDFEQWPSKITILNEETKPEIPTASPVPVETKESVKDSKKKEVKE